MKQLVLGIFFFTSLNALCDDFESSVFKIYTSSNHYVARREKVQSDWVAFENIFNKSELNLSSQLYRNTGRDIPSAKLQTTGYYQTRDSSLGVTGLYKFKNSPLLSSLQLSASAEFHKYDYQALSNASSPDGIDARQLVFMASYDLAKGGVNDQAYLDSKIESNIRGRSYYENINQVKISYLQFLRQALTLLAINCQLQNLEQSLKSIEETLSIAEVGSQVGTYAYKDLLNVRSLKNIVENRKLLAEVNFQTSFQKFSIFGEEAQKYVMSEIESKNYCRDYIGVESKVKNDIEEVQKLNNLFQKTLPNKIIDRQILESQNKLTITNLNRRPSVRPYVKNVVVHENLIGIDEKKYEIGVTFDWDLPYAYSFSITKSEILNLNSLKKQLSLSEKNFLNDMTNLHLRNKFLTKLITNVKKTVQINEELLRILSTQRSIGKTDSLSLTNAFLNKNESLNQLYESYSEIIYNNYSYFYELNWKNLLGERN